MTLWHGRLGGETAEEVMAFSVSLHYDRKLAADDLDGSRAAALAEWEKAGVAVVTAADIDAR